MVKRKQHWLLTPQSTESNHMLCTPNYPPNFFICGVCGGLTTSDYLCFYYYQRISITPTFLMTLNWVEFFSNTHLLSKQNIFHKNAHKQFTGLVFWPVWSLSFSFVVFLLHRDEAEPAVSLTLHCCIAIHLCLCSQQRHCQTGTSQEGYTGRASYTYTNRKYTYIYIYCQ